MNVSQMIAIHCPNPKCNKSYRIDDDKLTFGRQLVEIPTYPGRKFRDAGGDTLACDEDLV